MHKIQVVLAYKKKMKNQVLFQSSQWSVCPGQSFNFQTLAKLSKITKYMGLGNIKAQIFPTLNSEIVEGILLKHSKKRSTLERA